MFKYELEKCILTHQYITEDLSFEMDEMEKFFNPSQTEKTFEEVYNMKVGMIDSVIISHIKEMPALSGKEAIELMFSRENIMKTFNQKLRYAEILHKNGHPFIKVLEELLEVSLEHIENYERAAQELKGKRIVAVVVDGNNHNLPPLRTVIEDNIVTLEKCHELVKNIRELGHEPKDLKFLLSIFTRTDGNECGDFPEECLLNKEITYNVRYDLLQVYKDDEFIYENKGGVIYVNPNTKIDEWACEINCT